MEDALAVGVDGGVKHGPVQEQDVVCDLIDPQGGPEFVAALGQDRGSLSLNQTGEMLAREPPLSAKEAEDVLASLIKWSDQRNLYRPSTEYLKLTLDYRPLTPTRPRTRLEDWLGFWQLPKESMQAVGVVT